MRFISRIWASCDLQVHARTWELLSRLSAEAETSNTTFIWVAISGFLIQIAIEFLEVYFMSIRLAFHTDYSNGSYSPCLSARRVVTDSRNLLQF